MNQLEKTLLDWRCEEVTPMEVYSDLFMLGSGYIQKSGAQAESRDLKGNPVGYWKNKDEKTGHYRIFFEDTFEETLKELQEADFAILNGISYFGRKNVQASASRMYGMIFDLDEVTGKTLNNFMSGALVAGAYPVPQYVILSGHGVHLYYIFDEPVPLYPNIKIQLKSLKYALIDKMWNSLTSESERRQYQGINQGFRVIGGKTKISGVRVRAFRVVNQPTSLKEMGETVMEMYRVDESKLWRESRLSLAKAKELYPEWYEKRVIQKERLTGHWVCKSDLYEWWKRQIRLGATLHHRYFAIMCLAIYAVKCGIPEDQLRKDAQDLIPFMNEISPSDPFTQTDVDSALECYDERYCTFPRDDISKLSDILIQKNKRNGLKQAEHLEEARAIRDIRSRRRGEKWDAHSGRKSKGDQVRIWREAHPDGLKAHCIKDLGLSKKTVYKHWDMNT